MFYNENIVNSSFNNNLSFSITELSNKLTNNLVNNKGHNGYSIQNNLI